MSRALAGVVLRAWTAHAGAIAQPGRGGATAIAGVTVIPCAARTGAGATSRTEMKAD